MVLLRFFSTKTVNDALASLGLLALRVAISAMMLTHGLYKLSHFSTMSQTFDPIGLGGTLSLSLVIFAEVFCSIALILGLLTRLAILPLIVAMCVAVFSYAGQPFAAKELAMLYLSFYVFLFITGPGRISVDRFIWG